jgi:hypothetical protein
MKGKIANIINLVAFFFAISTPDSYEWFEEYILKVNN